MLDAARENRPADLGHRLSGQAGAAAEQYLAQNGNPYARIAADASGLTAINWGVYGVPETYFIDKTGIVRWRYAGPLTDDIVNGTLNQLLRQYS